MNNNLPAFNSLWVEYVKSLFDAVKSIDSYYEVMMKGSHRIEIKINIETFSSFRLGTLGWAMKKGE